MQASPAARCFKTPAVARDASLEREVERRSVDARLAVRNDILDHGRSRSSDSVSIGPILRLSQLTAPPSGKRKPTCHPRYHKPHIINHLQSRRYRNFSISAVLAPPGILRRSSLGQIPHIPRIASIGGLFRCRNGTWLPLYLARISLFCPLTGGFSLNKRTSTLRGTLVKVPLDQWVTQPWTNWVCVASCVGQYEVATRGTLVSARQPLHNSFGATRYLVS